MIRYRCPECGEESSYSDDLAGASISCPKCRVGITVPRDAGIAPARDGLSPAELEMARASLDRAAKGPPTPSGDAPSFLPMLLVTVGVAAAFLVLTWFLAGTAWLYIGTVIASGLAAAFFLPVLFGLAKDMAAGGRAERQTFGRMLLWSLPVAATFIAAFVIHTEFPVATIHIDNATGKTVRLKLESDDWLTVPPNKPMTASLRKGSYSIAVLDADGKALDTMACQVDSVGPYVLNVLGQQAYARGSVQYGGFAFGGNSETEIRDRWFKADADYLFQTPPSSITVSVRRGQSAGSATRTFLRRGKAAKGK